MLLRLHGLPQGGVAPTVGAPEVAHSLRQTALTQIPDLVTGICRRAAFCAAHCDYA